MNSHSIAAAKRRWSRYWVAPSSPRGVSPQNATRGVPARLAQSIEVASCETPGPLVVVTTPGCPAPRAQPSAMPRPEPSCRTSYNRTPRSASAAIQCMLASPIMPKTSLVPSLTNASARAS